MCIRDRGYDGYRYNLAEIGHKPYELASLLTVEFENYTRSQVQARLQSIFVAIAHTGFLPCPDFHLFLQLQLILRFKNTLEPVSYTHLEVYKRQAVYRTVRTVV